MLVIKLYYSHYRLCCTINLFCAQIFLADLLDVWKRVNTKLITVQGMCADHVRSHLWQSQAGETAACTCLAGACAGWGFTVGWPLAGEPLFWLQRADCREQRVSHMLHTPILQHIISIHFYLVPHWSLQSNYLFLGHHKILSFFLNKKKKNSIYKKGLFIF